MRELLFLFIFDFTCIKVNKRRQLLPGPSPTSPSSSRSSPTRPMARWCRFGNIDPFPFDGRSFFTESMFRSGSTHPRAIAVDSEPSSTSAFQGLVRIVATTTKIGTGGGSGPARAWTFSTPTAAPSYSQSTNNGGSAVGHGWRRLSALHFQGRSHFLAKRRLLPIIDESGTLLFCVCGDYKWS